MTMTAPSAPTAPSAQMLGVQFNVVVLKNPATAPKFRMRYGPTQLLELDPGQEAFVPEEVAWHFLGRWWMDNSNPRRRQRVEEYRRLRVLYGAYEDDDLWAVNRPKIEAFTAAGERITTVVDDPDGVTSIRSLTPQSREQQLEVNLEFMQRQVAELQRKMDLEIRSREAGQQPAPPDDLPSPTVTAPGPVVPGPVYAEGPQGVQLPVAPTEISQPDFNAPVINSAGETEALPARLPVVMEIIEPPVDSTDEVPEDAPRRVRVG